MKKTLLIIVVAVVLIIIAGLICFKLGFIAGKKSLESEIAQYKKVIDYYFPIPKEIISISGKITEIQDKVLSIETTAQTPYVLPSEWKTKVIKVTVIDETKIFKFDMQTAKQIDITVSDLKVGDQVSAGAKENIKDKTEFVADYINLMVMPTPPTLPPSPPPAAQ